MGNTPNRISVEVTEKDIERAHVNDSYKCVVSQAIARTVKTATHIETDTQAIRFTVDGERRVYLTPYAVQGYVIAFDAGEPIEPFSFRLDRPQVTRKTTRTELGKAADREANRARRAAKAAVADSQQSATERPKKEKVKQDDPREAAKAAYSAVVAQNPDEPRKQPEPGRKAPPRVFKKRKRSYGHRLLRINQQDGGIVEETE